MSSSNCIGICTVRPCCRILMGHGHRGSSITIRSVLEIVKNFLLHTFAVTGLRWITLLRAYGKITGDYALQERAEFQTGIRLILNLCLKNGFDMFPTLLVTDGSCVFDRRMGIFMDTLLKSKWPSGDNISVVGVGSWPVYLKFKILYLTNLVIQALFYSALRCFREMLIVNDGTKDLVAVVNNRLSALSFHIREYYWVVMKKINEMYRCKTEEHSTDAVNKFNIYPDQKAVALAEKRLSMDHWPEFCDTKIGRFIGKQSRLHQTWTIAGYLTSKMLLENPDKASLLFWEEDYELLETCVCALNKTSRKKCSRFAAKSQVAV